MDFVFKLLFLLALAVIANRFFMINDLLVSLLGVSCVAYAIAKAISLYRGEEI